MKSKLPNSLRIAIVVLAAAVIVAVVMTQLHAAKDQTAVNNLLPDAQLPWNESKDVVEQFMNTFYGKEGTSFALKEQKNLKGVYRVYFTQGGVEVKSNMIFNFVDGKLWSYTRQFKGSMLKNVLLSAKFNYSKGDEKHAGGYIKSSTREFYIYEKEMEEINGSLELYVVYDKHFKVIRTQSRFIKIQ